MSQRILQRRCGLEKDHSILVGVSGGADSLCLLQLLVDDEYPIIVAHFDHRLRPESHHDAQYVENLAHRMGVQFVTEAADVGKYAREQSLSIEEAARTMRYRFLFREARRVGAQAVAVGHTADDQVETVLMHLLRGSGISGLKGMTYRTVIPEWDEQTPLVRPILHLWRTDTVRCCQEAGITPIEDLTNQETTFYRNRLRHELVPLLETYNPQAKEHIARMAEILSGDHALLEDLTQGALSNAMRSSGPGFLSLSLPALQAMSEALLRRVLRSAILRLSPSLRELDFKAIERAVALINHPTSSGRVELVQNFSMQVESDVLYVTQVEQIRESRWPQLDEATEVELPIPGQMEFGSEWVIAAEEETCRPGKKTPDRFQDPFHAWLDADLLGYPLLVRARRDGDRFQPLGMETGRVKISNYFTNKKLPRPARDRWPLVISKGDIVWVPGFAPAHWARIKPETRRVIHLTLYQSTPS